MIRIILSVFITLFAHCAKADKIALIVGSYPVTEYEINQRILLEVAMMRHKEPKASINREKIKDMVINAMIDDVIKLDYAIKSKINLSEEDLERAMQSFVVSMQFKSLKSLKDFLLKNKIDYESFLSFAKTEIMWSMLINYGIVPTINISIDELNAAVKVRYGFKSPGDRQVEEVRAMLIEEKATITARRMLGQMKKLYLIEVL